MPDFVLTEVARPSFFGPSLSADHGPPAPVTSPITFTTAGNYRQRLPLDVPAAKVEVYGGGAGGAAGTAGAGGKGGSAGGYASATLGTGLLVAGSFLDITVGKAGTAGGNGFLSKVECAAVTVVSATGGTTDGGAAGAGTVTVHAGISSGVTHTGGTGGNAGLGTGGVGGTGPAPASAAGGTGGASGGANPGNPGTAPGAGAGGGSADAALPPGGAGGAARVVVSWPP